MNNLSTILSSFGFSWLDVVLLIVFAVYAFEGLQAGFLAALLDFFSFVLSFVSGLLLYSKVAFLITQNVTITQGFANAISFFLIAFVSEIAMNIVLNYASRFVLRSSNQTNDFLAKLNRIFGFIPSLLSAFVLLAFLLSLIASLPLSPILKHSISSSKIATGILAKTQGIEGIITAVFGGAVKDTLNFLTVEPQSNESVSLHFKVGNASIDENAQNQMLALVNKERALQGQSFLAMDVALQKVAQNHARDMLTRGYFSHYTPEGLSPFDRMGAANISFNYAGENLALSPNTELAMQGLMQSPGHRANILSPNFGKVGIGVLDAGIYGEMFVQEFRD